METRHPVEIYFGREYAAICYHCAVLVACSRQNWNIFETFLRFFFEKRPLMIKFSKLCSESLHRDTDRRCRVQNSWKMSDGKSVKSCVVYLTKKTQFRLPLKLSLLDRAQTLPWPPLNIWLTNFQFHPNLFTFGGVIAGRVKAVKTRPKANPILGEAIASRRVIKPVYR